MQSENTPYKGPIPESTAKMLKDAGFEITNDIELIYQVIINKGHDYILDELNKMADTDTEFSFLNQHTKIKMPRYRFRAECMDDIEELSKLFSINSVNAEISFDLVKGLPDCEAILETEIPIEDIRFFMNSVVDGHVMAQTVKPEAEYTGERDYTL